MAFKADRNASVRLNLMAVTVSGPDRLRDYGVPAYQASGSAEINTRTTFQASLRTSYRIRLAPSGQLICWGDDKIQSDASVIRVMLMPGSGYMIDPNKRWVDYTIFDMDNCSDPAGRTQNGGIVYQFNSSGGAWGTCTCAEESYAVRSLRARRGVGEDPGQFANEEALQSYASAAASWMTDSTNYCPESPHQRPG